jgi:hypothetical protein
MMRPVAHLMRTGTVLAAVPEVAEKEVLEGALGEAREVAAGVLGWHEATSVS